MWQAFERVKACGRHMVSVRQAHSSFVSLYFVKGQFDDEGLKKKKKKKGNILSVEKVQ